MMKVHISGNTFRFYFRESHNRHINTTYLDFAFELVNDEAPDRYDGMKGMGEGGGGEEDESHLGR